MLSERNFRQWIADLQAAMRRTQHYPDQGRSTARYCELIGNVCWHFAPQEAAGWFRRSLETRRAADWEPNWISANLLWKLGDRDGLRDECDKAIEIHRGRLHDLQARERLKERHKARDHQAAIYRELHELATVTLLLEDFRAASEWARAGMEEDVRWSQWDPGRGQKPSSAYLFVRDCCEALLNRRSGEFQEALKVLRAELDMWPTDAGSLIADLYRFGLSLGRAHFADDPSYRPAEGSANSRA